MWNFLSVNDTCFVLFYVMPSDVCILWFIFVFSPFIGYVPTGYAQQLPQPPTALVFFKILLIFLIN